VQEAIKEVWEIINTENLKTVSGFNDYKKEFLQLFGFEYDGVDYDADVEINCEDPELIQ
jgi:enoyl-[acyl-carrier protein] reductase/trans-2-enoyl-CoA reductase (NAD+)